ncbi:MAG TPA: RNase adapter RapZ [Alphaproteobacteria bacterium]|nr:RNase adapter RapZ [Alphaproteobacteria bacterium]
MSVPRKSSGRGADRRRRGVPTQLVVITGMSGSGKASVLKAFEDLGFYCVDNLPVGLIPSFAELIQESTQIEKAALVADIREGEPLKNLPNIIGSIRKQLRTTVIFLEASDDVLLRRFSETRRPHPLGKASPVKTALVKERKMLQPIRKLADVVVDTSKFNVHELRSHITAKFAPGGKDNDILVSVISFGYKAGVPVEADLLFDVRFLPNPHFVPAFRPLTGRHPKVARYIRSFPQTQEFINRISALLIYLIPHYMREGKSYLTIGFGCTGGQHRSVFIAEEVRKRLAKSGHKVKVSHRDSTGS